MSAAPAEKVAREYEDRAENEAEESARCVSDGMLSLGAAHNDEASECRALAALVRAGAVCANGARVMGWDIAKDWDAVLAQLAAALGVKEEA